MHGHMDAWAHGCCLYARMQGYKDAWVHKYVDVSDASTYSRPAAKTTRSAGPDLEEEEVDEEHPG